MPYNTTDNLQATHEDPTIELACEFISRPSVTPEDHGCQTLIANRLAALGFTIEPLVFEDTTNLWARRGSKGPLFCFAGHTDVVPTGDASKWRFPPFQPTIDNALLYGRGAADMKGSLAAMIVATERFFTRYSDSDASVAFLITSDEEGPATHGTRRVIETLEARNEKIDWCLVGEPSSTNTLGDVIKVGRRGSLTGELCIQGKQGHVAYPHLAKNPVHDAALLLHELASTEWDQGNAFFPQTSFQISNIHAGTGAGNVIPGTLDVMFNFRYSTEVTSEVLQQRVIAILEKHQLNYTIKWTNNGYPFLTDHGALVPAITHAVNDVCGHTPQALTTGGTSDGRFIAPTGAEVVELGPINASIHQINEHVSVNDLIHLTDAYFATLERLFVTHKHEGN